MEYDEGLCVPLVYSLCLDKITLFKSLRVAAMAPELHHIHACLSASQHYSAIACFLVRRPSLIAGAHSEGWKHKAANDPGQAVIVGSWHIGTSALSCLRDMVDPGAGSPGGRMCGSSCWKVCWQTGNSPFGENSAAESHLTESHVPFLARLTLV